MVLWLYTAIVRPILTYGSLVWWPALSKQYICLKLSRIQRSACIGATGALRTTPTDAMNVLLHLHPPDIHTKYLATCSALRLKAAGRWVDKPYGHGRILSNQGNSLQTDLMTVEVSTRKLFKTRIPERDEWNRGNILEEFVNIIYTDGSKMDSGVGAGVFSVLGIADSYKLPDSSSVFQAEIVAIWKACEFLLNLTIPPNRVAIATDSQAAIKALKSFSVKSWVVKSCLESIQNVASRKKVTLIWVPGHSNHEGNEKADELARLGTSLDQNCVEQVRTPFCNLKREMYSKLQKTACVNAQLCQL